jgi:hypothetical protein
MSDVFGGGQAVSGIAQAAGSVAAAAVQAAAINNATKTVADSAQKALDFQTATTAHNQAVQQPFITAGANALTDQASEQANYAGSLAPYQAQLNALMPGQMSQADLEATPGYQFNLSQGLQATQNAAAAKGLGVSGAALKGAATYATGLADSTYQNQFANAQTRFGDAQTQLSNQKGILDSQFSQTAGRIQVGENAATGSGTQGQAGATNAGQIATTAGAAMGAGAIAGGNALAGGINGVANSISQNNALAAFNNGGGIYGGTATGGQGFQDQTSSF